MRPSNHLSLGRPLLLLPSVFPSIRVFSSESDLQIRWPNYWSFISVLSMNIQGWFLLGLTGLISLLFKGLSGVFSSTIVQKHQFFHAQPSLWPKLSHPYMTTGKTIALTIENFVDKVMSLLFNTLFRSVIAFLPRSKCLLISWLQSPSAVILEPPKNKVWHCFHSSSISHDVMGPDAMISVFWMLSFKPVFSSRGSLVSLSFLPLGWYHLHVWGDWYFSQQSCFQLVLLPAQPFSWCTLHRS